MERNLFSPVTDAIEAAEELLYKRIISKLPVFSSIDSIFEKLAREDTYFATRQKPTKEALKIIANTKPLLFNDLALTKLLCYLWVSGHKSQFYTALSYARPGENNVELIKSLSKWMPKR